MKPPLEVQELCELYLEKVRQDPRHELTEQERWELYLKFGRALMLNSSYPVHLPNRTPADIALCRLVVLCAKEVAFICKRGPEPPEFNESEAAEVKAILKVAECYLNRKISYEAAVDVLENYWYFFRPHLTYDVLSAWSASMAALESILRGFRRQECNPAPGFDSFVFWALEAYTVIDRNLPGEGELPEPPIPLEYDTRKRLKFWEWWLTEAIPLAWELTGPRS